MEASLWNDGEEKRTDKKQSFWSSLSSSQGFVLLLTFGFCYSTQNNLSLMLLWFSSKSEDMACKEPVGGLQVSDLNAFCWKWRIVTLQWKVKGSCYVMHLWTPVNVTHVKPTLISYTLPWTVSQDNSASAFQSKRKRLSEDLTAIKVCLCK